MPNTGLRWCAGPAASLASFPLAPPAQARAEEAVRAGPIAETARSCLLQAHAALAVGRHDVALGWFNNAASLDASSMPRLGAAICLLELGREEDAAAQLEEAYETCVKPGEVDVQLARLYFLAGERSAAFQEIGLAIGQDASWAAVVKNDRAFAVLRDHPTFLQILGEI